MPVAENGGGVNGFESKRDRAQMRPVKIDVRPEHVIGLLSFGAGRDQMRRKRRLVRCAGGDYVEGAAGFPETFWCAHVSGPLLSLRSFGLRSTAIYRRYETTI